MVAFYPFAVINPLCLKKNFSHSTPPPFTILIANSNASVSPSKYSDVHIVFQILFALFAAIRGGSLRCYVLLQGRRYGDCGTDILSDHILQSSSGSSLQTRDVRPGSCVHSSYHVTSHKDNRFYCLCYVEHWPDGAFSFSYFSVSEITFRPFPGRP